MRAVEREVLAAIRPVVSLTRPAVATLLVEPSPCESLAGSARVHHKSELLVVLRDGKRRWLETYAAHGMRTPSRRQQLDDTAAIECVDRLAMAAPAALHLIIP